ncbi:sulfotransferase [Pseudomonas sp. JH-2]|uniref:sulfotransferase family protein n=1 Tax=unclassified Pseudomonas TaxID=196821 RepID=UPI000D6F1AF8|nr:MULTISPECIES: sulfotransferase [unclassified Pseudomonas]MED5610383.1 sulfotransferase [Pseudomonas sp. JH-2]PWU29985.1 sulfotransferase family protein [Pseudomonas sp. RW407]
MTHSLPDRVAPGFCVVFVTHGGALEYKAALLATSLRARLGEKVPILAALATPASSWGALSEASHNLYDRLAIPIREIENPFGTAYPIGNKFAALALGEGYEHTLFLDTDMYCLHAPDFDALRQAEAALKPADMALVPTDANYWGRLYGVLGLDLPQMRVLASHDQEVMPGYFNAGFIWVRDAGQFAASWLRVAKRLVEEPGLEHKWPWLDQLALPLALVQLQKRIRSLDERYNFPLHLKPLGKSGRGPFFCHYHDLPVLAREPELLGDMQGLQQRFPELAEVLRQSVDVRAYSPAWFAGSGVSPCLEDAGRDLLITGLPRSGTSHLCRLLSERRDTVIINEPAEVFPALASGATPWGIPRLYGELRRDLLAGLPVPNKHVEGRLVDDTAREFDHRLPYRAQLQSRSFTLGTKNTLAYLSRLPELHRVMPDATCIALVRHPYDSLSSWKRTFEHLRTAAVQAQPVGHPDDPGLSGWQRKMLREVVACDCLPVRRALWWRYLACQLLEMEQHLRWMRYEDLVSEPSGMLDRLLGSASLPDQAPLSCLGNEMDEHERELVAAVVSDVAGSLGYVL